MIIKSIDWAKGEKDKTIYQLRNDESIHTSDNHDELLKIAKEILRNKSKHQRFQQAIKIFMNQVMKEKLIDEQTLFKFDDQIFIGEKAIDELINKVDKVLNNKEDQFEVL